MNMLLMYLGVVLLTSAVIFWKKAVVSQEEYLYVLSYEWKEGEEIHCGLERLKNGWISLPEFYAAMQRLVDSGLAEISIEVNETAECKTTIAYYRKKAGGKRHDEEGQLLQDQLSVI